MKPEEVLKSIDKGQISFDKAKDIFEKMLVDYRSPKEILENGNPAIMGNTSPKK